MSQAVVCSADTEFRSNCGAGCQSCAFLISDRRAINAGGMQWHSFERRSLINLMPALPSGAAVGSITVSGHRSMTASWYLLACLVFFNIVDCIMTTRALSLGYAEGNPVMAALLDINLPLAMSFKALLVAAGAYLLWYFRHLSIASMGLTALTGVYGLLVVYHLSYQLAI